MAVLAGYGSAGQAVCKIRSFSGDHPMPFQCRHYPHCAGPATSLSDEFLTGSLPLTGTKREPLVR